MRVGFGVSVDRQSNYVDTTLFLYAMSFLGVPYKYGGANPMSGIDCSGLCIELLKSCGVLPHSFDATAQGLYDRFSDPVYGSIAMQTAFGVLVFYGKSKKLISHVGFCVDGMRVIEAGSGDSKVVDRITADERNAFVRMRPIQYRSDFVAACLPNYKFSI